MSTLTDYLTTIANAIRSKKGTSDPINAQDFATEISSLSNKLPSILDRTVTQLTADDLAGVTGISRYAFSTCYNLTSVTIPNSVTSISRYAFSNCSSLTSITIPGSVTSIGENAFYNCTNLTSVVIGNGVQEIDSFAFSNCESLENITIPNSITSIGGSAFRLCTNLTDLNYSGTKTQWRNISLNMYWSTTSSIEVIHCSDGDITL